MEKILITGGAGFIGSTLANDFATEYEVFVIDDLSMGNVANLQQADGLTFIEGSVTDQALMTQILQTHTFAYIFHFAAVASVADSVARPVVTHTVNFESVLHLLENIRLYQKNLKRLVFASSAAVYGDEPTLPKAEESVIRPLTPYAIDKFAAEKYVIDYYHLYGVPTSAVRFFNVYGPNQNPSSPYSGVISILMARHELLKKGAAASFTLFGDGEQSRDFIYIEDVMQALKLVATAEASLGETYNVGTGECVTLNDLIHYLDDIFGQTLPIVHESARAGDIRASLADIQKLRSLGFQAQYTVKNGLKTYVSTQKKDN